MRELRNFDIRGIGDEPIYVAPGVEPKLMEPAILTLPRDQEIWTEGRWAELISCRSELELVLEEAGQQMERPRVFVSFRCRAKDGLAGQIAAREPHAYFACEMQLQEKSHVAANAQFD